jgi:predicted SprT family Zn-dependent metalloprotease
MYDYKDVNIINEKAKFYTKELWGKEYDKTVSLNSRLSSTFGRFSTVTKNIELSKDFVDLHKELTIDDTLIHELTHWYCNITHKSDKDKSYDFENELKRVGAKTAGTGHWAGLQHIAICSKCKKVVGRERNYRYLERYLNNDDYVSRCCRKIIIYNGTMIFEDDYQVSQKILELNNKYNKYYKNKLGISA